jgi:nucleotide-binding universal stress UspA family protein
MPATSIRDLVIKDDDLVVGTHGRGSGSSTTSRRCGRSRATATQAAYLFKPQRAWRFRWNKNTDTPLPPDEPAGQNPPDGAILDYWLPRSASDIALEIIDGAGSVVRRYSSRDVIAPIVDTGNVPAYWIRPQRALSTTAGMHRFVWDLHFPPVPEKKPSYPISAIVHDTPLTPSSPLAMPGDYTVRLTVDGRALTQPLTLQMDPRVKTPREELAQQFDASMKVYAKLRENPGRDATRVSLEIQPGDEIPRIRAIGDAQLDAVRCSAENFQRQPRLALWRIEPNQRQRALRRTIAAESEPQRDRGGDGREYDQQVGAGGHEKTIKPLA